MTEYYIVYNGQQVGPMSKEALVNYGLNPNSQVWAQGMPAWVPAYTIPELMEVINTRPLNTPPPHPGTGFDSLSDTGTSGKSRLAAGLFAIILGTLGIQYFYCGKTAGGIICILLSLVTCGFWGIITLIQGILMIVMSQQEFEQKYVYSSSTFPIF